MSSLVNRVSVKDILLGIVFILALLWATIWPVGQKFSIEVEYGNAPEGIKAQVFWSAGNGGFTETNSSICDVVGGKVNFDLGRDFTEIQGIRIDPSNTGDAFSIRTIKYYINDTVIAVYGCNSLMDFFTLNNATYTIDTSAGLFCVAPENNDVGIVTLSDAFTTILNESTEQIRAAIIKNRISYIVLFFVVTLIVLHCFPMFLQYLEKMFAGKNSCFNVLAVGGMLLVAITAWVIAFTSKLGAHPDEWDVVECLKYGMTHWFPPDIRDSSVAGTFSGYGYTKLENGTWYFLIAGKIAWLVQWLFRNINWFRVPNVILFFILVYLYCKNIAKKNWLILSCGICVQAWYIFSYTTADALDFFLSFVVLLQLTDEKSLLNKTIQLPLDVKNIFRCLALGVLFGMLFLGKQVYWAVLLLSFVVLLLKLIYAEKDKKKLLLFNYGIIVGFFCLTIVGRYSFDLYHYGLQKTEIKEELEIQYAHYDKNPTTPLEDRCPTYHMYSNGRELHELFEECPGWFKSSFRSFCGLVADMETSEVYYITIGCLYLFVYFCLAYFNLKKDTTVKRKLEFILCSAIMIMSFLASILNSYFIDCQAQGRYLLPMVIVAGYIGYKTPEAFSKSYFKVAVLALNFMSVWYFAVRALRIIQI